jgi:hypothetical protein
LFRLTFYHEPFITLHAQDAWVVATGNVASTRPLTPQTVPYTRLACAPWQISNVVFVQGLVAFKDQFILYYGTADSLIAGDNLLSRILQNIKSCGLSRFLA